MEHGADHNHDSTEYKETVFQVKVDTRVAAGSVANRNSTSRRVFDATTRGVEGGRNVSFT